MHLRSRFFLGWLVAGLVSASAQIPVLKRSDVVFMYQAGRPAYQEYGGTVLAWGGRPTPATLADAKDVKFFGSVGMVTEFNRYCQRFPTNYEQGLCRDLNGQPFKVPWLTDHQYRGIPYWWCCTHQPLFRQYISERVTDTVQAGAYGVHVDDHLGTAGSLWSGGCFCDRCVEGFRGEVRNLPPEELARLQIPNADTYDYRKIVQEWVARQPGRKPQSHPLYERFRSYQLRDAAQFMMDLRQLAAQTAGHPVPMSANACLLWGPHLNDYLALDYFSAEIEHHAPQRRLDDSPVVAYRVADAVGRPLASTASGQDWAYIKEQNLPGLVQSWVALSYAAGHCLMVPYRQWCYTTAKGTHWYEGPKEKFAPLFQFVRQHAVLFDDFDNLPDLTLAFAHRTFAAQGQQIVRACNQLAAAHLSYRLLLGGDDVVDHPLPAAALRASPRLLVLEPKDFTPADQRLLATLPESQTRLANVAQALTNIVPAVRLESEAAVRLFPRVKPGAAVIHLVNWNYDAARDGVVPVRNLRLKLDLAGLGLPGATEARVHSPGAQPQTLRLDNATLTVPELHLWSVLELRTGPGVAQ